MVGLHLVKCHYEFPGTSGHLIRVTVTPISWIISLTLLEKVWNQMSPVVKSGDVSCWLRGVPSFMIDTERQADRQVWMHKDTNRQTEIPADTGNTPAHPYTYLDRQTGNWTIRIYQLLLNSIYY